MKKQIKTSALVALSLFLGTGVSALKADTPWEFYGDQECRWACCNDGTHLEPAQPCCQNCGPFVGAEFIYWAQYRSDREIAIDEVSTLIVGGTNVPVANGKFHHSHTRWDPGFRIDLGYRFGCDGWDFKAIWTHYDANHNTSARPGSGANGLLATDNANVTPLVGGIPPSVAATASSKERLHYNIADFLLERPYFVGCTHTLKPFFGVRAAWLRQKLDVEYTGFPSITTVGSYGSILGETSWSSHFEGVGLIAGLQYELGLCDCLSLYADFSGSLLTGRRNDHTNITNFVSPISTIGDELLNVSEKGWTLLPGYHIGTGFFLERNVCGMCVVLNLGYEFNQWFFLSTLPKFPNNTEKGINLSHTNGTLLLHGVNVGANIYF